MDFLQSIIAFLDGKKTLIGAVVLFIAGGLLALGVIDQKTFEIVAAIAAAITAGGLRHAISKLQ